MPKSKPAKAQAPFNGFINYELSVEQKTLLKKRDFPSDLIDSEIVRLNEAGYKVSFSSDTYSGGHAAFLVATQQDNENYGWVLSGRGSTPIKALKQLLYKHWELFEGSWPKSLDASREDFDD